MIKSFVGAFALCVVVGTAAAQSPSPAPSPSDWKPVQPSKEHSWLKQLEGEWDLEGEAIPGPGKPPLKSTGHESAKMLGGFFLVTDLEGKGDMGEMHARMAVGYDPKSKKYTGSWVSDMDATHWVYTGEVDASGKKLALLADGPDMADPTRTAKYKDEYEIVDADHRVLRSSLQSADGKWTEFMTMRYTRKK